METNMVHRRSAAQLSQSGVAIVFVGFITWVSYFYSRYKAYRLISGDKTRYDGLWTNIMKEPDVEASLQVLKVRVDSVKTKLSRERNRQMLSTCVHVRTEAIVSRAKSFHGDPRFNSAALLIGRQPSFRKVELQLVESLDQLFHQAAGVYKPLLSKVQEWALTSNGYFAIHKPSEVFHSTSTRREGASSSRYGGFMRRGSWESSVSNNRDSSSPFQHDSFLRSVRRVSEDFLLSPLSTSLHFHSSPPQHPLNRGSIDHHPPSPINEGSCPSQHGTLMSRSGGEGRPSSPSGEAVSRNDDSVRRDSGTSSCVVEPLSPPAGYGSFLHISSRNHVDRVSESEGLQYVKWSYVKDDEDMLKRIRWAALKKPERAIEKLVREYGHHRVWKLLDLCRQSIIFSSVQDLLSCFSTITSDPDVVVTWVKNRFDPAYDPWTSAGYRDVALNLRLQTDECCELGLNHHICEVQLQLMEFAAVKDDAGHKRYVKFRNERGK